MPNKEKLDEKINQFIEIAKKSTPGNGLLDNGLIVIEDLQDDNDISGINILEAVNKDVVSHDNPSNYVAFLNKLVEANNAGQTLLINLEKDPDSNTISILKQLSQKNRVSIPNFNDQELFQIELKPETRVVVCAKRSFIENDLSYKFFYNLFGPILTI